MGYGLTFAQAEIYLSLLTNGQFDVHQLVSITNMHRSDVYRRIKDLKDIGMIDCILGSPNKFEAIPPGDVLNLLQRKIKDSVNRLSSGSGEFARELEDLRMQARMEGRGAGLQQGNLASPLLASFSLISGRKRYWREVKSMISRADKEVLRIVDREGLKNMFSTTTELFSELKRAAERGVQVKLISDIGPENYQETSYYVKYFEIRHLAGIALRFIDVDANGVILCGSLDRTKDDPEEGKFLKFYDNKFGVIMKFFFDELWTVAEPVNETALPWRKVSL
jgi:sugar-specific transcriptional regulator TrmB